MKTHSCRIDTCPHGKLFYQLSLYYYVRTYHDLFNRSVKLIRPRSLTKNKYAFSNTGINCNRKENTTLDWIIIPLLHTDIYFLN